MRPGILQHTLWLGLLLHGCAALRVTRRAVGGGIALAVAAPRPAGAAAEWAVGALRDKAWAVSKRQASSVRIRPETMLVAADAASDRELRLVKVPLGRGAAASFDMEAQLALVKYFESRADAARAGPAAVARIMKASLEKQAASPQSPLQRVALDPATAALTERGGRRYVSYAYVTDGCRRLDEDGGCVRRSTRRVSATVTVSLESQARTLEEQRRMDDGEMEQRYIDTLWVLTCSAPEKGADDAALRAATDSLSVGVPDAALLSS